MACQRWAGASRSQPIPISQGNGAWDATRPTKAGAQQQAARDDSPAPEPFRCSTRRWGQRGGAEQRRRRLVVEPVESGHVRVNGVLIPGARRAGR